MEYIVTGEELKALAGNALEYGKSIKDEEKRQRYIRALIKCQKKPLYVSDEEIYQVSNDW